MCCVPAWYMCSKQSINTSYSNCTGVVINTVSKWHIIGTATSNCITLSSGHNLETSLKFIRARPGQCLNMHRSHRIIAMVWSQWTDPQLNVKFPQEHPPPSNSIWPHLSYGLVRSKREYCHNCSLVVTLCSFCSCTLIWAAYRFCLPDLASSHWVHSLCLDYFVCVRLFSCIISVCML